jgi:hypothetical protein
MSLYLEICFSVISALLSLKHNKKKAETMYWQLIDRNPENAAYYKGLEEAIQPGFY